ncbi:MAG: hypothetical protein ACQRW7_07965, partial [Caulobacterales bacterium]|uniref:hypothetical protein n=1 Tax=Glycocaulis sp. TaxID=1969725 RepID=UPI003FA0CE06
EGERVRVFAKIAAGALLLAVCACSRDNYTADLAFTGSLEDVRALIEDGYFYKEHTYTIYLGPDEFDVGGLSNGSGFTLPVEWQFELESCRALMESIATRRSELYLVQGQPLEDGGPFFVWFLAEIIDADTLQTCGEARKGFHALGRWNRVDL